MEPSTVDISVPLVAMLCPGTLLTIWLRSSIMRSGWLARGVIRLIAVSILDGMFLSSAATLLMLSLLPNPIDILVCMAGGVGVAAWLGTARTPRGSEFVRLNHRAFCGGLGVGSLVGPLVALPILGLLGHPVS